VKGREFLKFNKKAEVIPWLAFLAQKQKKSNGKI